jgi:hypothetical protein
MEVINNLWQEQLHDIFVTTHQGRKLRLRIDHDNAGYALAGEFFEIDNKSWYLVEFSKARAPYPAALLATCLANLQQAMQQKSDFIEEIHNTTPTPVVSLEKQQEIVNRMGIPAQFRLH